MELRLAVPWGIDLPVVLRAGARTGKVSAFDSDTYEGRIGVEIYPQISRERHPSLRFVFSLGVSGGKFRTSDPAAVQLCRDVGWPGVPRIASGRSHPPRDPLGGRDRLHLGPKAGRLRAGGSVALDSDRGGRSLCLHAVRRAMAQRRSPIFPSHGDSPCSSFLRSAGMGGDPHDAQGIGIAASIGIKADLFPSFYEDGTTLLSYPATGEILDLGCRRSSAGDYRPPSVTLRAAHFRAFGHPVSHHFSHHCGVTGWTSRLRHRSCFQLLGTTR